MSGRLASLSGPGPGKRHGGCVTRVPAVPGAGAAGESDPARPDREETHVAPCVHRTHDVKTEETGWELWAKAEGSWEWHVHHYSSVPSNELSGHLSPGTGPCNQESSTGAPVSRPAPGLRWLPAGHTQTWAEGPALLQPGFLSAVARPGCSRPLCNLLTIHLLVTDMGYEKVKARKSAEIWTKERAEAFSPGSDDEDELGDRTFMYYVNDGVYGSFNCIFYDRAYMKPLLQKRPKPDEKYYSSSIWGPTCDDLDRFVERCDLQEMHVGDWLIFENMGAVHTL
ncbi:Ornithine decarboxylase [Galemys pyrenaicus]|uniref:ornithine decarboxylase n=1 Tax=Galemys pyrenaicus TaxID=202257 RepID=A0A8J6ALP8_GALPY|nr:Ornithine decarboxylase [Galemys pyrenaicus]